MVTTWSRLTPRTQAGAEDKDQKLTSGSKPRGISFPLFQVCMITRIQWHPIVSGSGGRVRASTGGWWQHATRWRQRREALGGVRGRGGRRTAQRGARRARREQTGAFLCIEYNSLSFESRRIERTSSCSKKIEKTSWQCNDELLTSAYDMISNNLLALS